MSDSLAPRPPYRDAVIVSLVVLAGLLLTLAPTVTFWDAGELIAATRILGIPHPPGTPLLVMLGHAWGTLLPIGEWAFRTNLMTATFAALSAGLFFLVVHESLEGWTAGGIDGRTNAPWARTATAAAAALAGAFSFTNWQNSTETEAYAIALFSIAAMTWLALRWRAARDTARAPKVLLLVLFIAGLAIGNHLLALLVGPAVVTFLVVTLRATPAADARLRRQEWARVAVVAGTWALLIGSGLGSGTLTVLGAACYLAATVFAFSAGVGGFALAALFIAAVGITPYAFLYVRSGQAPMINEAAPSTWNALLDVIRRAQYPVRTPFDDPTVMHGPDNPGRSLTVIGLQLLNYLQYFDWQWGKAAGRWVRLACTVLFFSMGLRGLLVQRESDRGGWWLLFTLWLVTGLGLVAYMNFRPGFSVGYEAFPSPEDHEVRERDYFYVVSYVVWGLWAAIGLADVAKGAAAKGGTARYAWGLVALALLPIPLNWREATRRGPDRTLAADFAYDMLNSVPPYGILFTYGDNDTFPLWWAQEVAGIRRDVTVVCLALAQTDWYMRQVRDNPLRDFDAAGAPAPWHGMAAEKPGAPVHAMTDAEIAAASERPVMLDKPTTVPFGPIAHTYPARTIFYPNDLLALRIIQQNIGRRPIAWAITTGRDFSGLADYVVQQGLVFRLETALPDTTAPGLVSGGVSGRVMDLPLTRTLIWDTYRYGALLTSSNTKLESTAASIASTMSIPFTLAAYHYDRMGDSTAVLQNLERAQQLAPSEAIETALSAYRRRVPGS
jgi:hypothetical protein